MPLGLEIVPQTSHKARTTARGLDQGSCAVEERHVSGKCTPSLHPHAFLRLSSCTSTLVTPAHCACGLGTGNLSSLLPHWLICYSLGLPGPWLALQEGLKLPEWPGDQPSGRVPLPSPHHPHRPAPSTSREGGATAQIVPMGWCWVRQGAEKGVSLQTSALPLPSPPPWPHLQAVPSHDCWLKMAFPPPPSSLAGIWIFLSKPPLHEIFPASLRRGQLLGKGIYLP